MTNASKPLDEQDEYSPEAIRLRLAKQHGVNIGDGNNTGEQQTSEPVSNANMTDAQIFAALDAAEKKRKDDLEKNSPYTIGPASVAGSLGYGAGHILGQKTGVVPSTIYNAQNNLTDLNRRFDIAQKISEEANQLAHDWQQHHDWLHTPHAINEHLPDEFRIVSENDYSPTQTRTERNVQGSDKGEIGTGRERGTAYNTRTAQEAERAKELARIHKKLGLDTNSPLAKYPDVTATKEGLIINKQTGQILNAEEQAKYIARENAIQSAKNIIEPQQKNAVEQLRLANLEREKAAIAASELATERAAAQSALASSKSTLNPMVRRVVDAMGAGSKYMPEIVNAGARAASKYLGPIAAITAPENIGMGFEELQKGQYGRGLSHMAGGVGGTLALAPLAVGAGLLAPEIGIGLAGAGALASLPSLYYDASDLYKKFTEHK